ncbi:hypothetical protein AHMF7605_08345 [Adhaeribacter arboris]|uniref:Uncharacterized protein n=1 Tax=Adhaeribacter arboris TaxID=2072846 RepID=A0A2T2YDG2_9BACT|nr:hypothetical protein [Adhaeribacter arboris]PSR53533.1 hypothetical protein AHMF7605_08345 [Adhaeribacter arboris]
MKNKNLQNLVNKAILSALLVVVTFMLPSCFLFGNDDDEEDPKPDTPRSEVPTILAKKWLAGQFSMTEFWQYDGTYSGNAFEAGLAFDFQPNGDCEFYLVAGGTTYGCRTELLVYKKGTVQFNQDNQSFTFYPTEGRSRGFYRGCASSFKNYDQKTEQKDLKPEIYYYTLQKDSNGQDQLVTRFEPNSTSTTTFRTVNW